MRLTFTKENEKQRARWQRAYPHISKISRWYTFIDYHAEKVKFNTCFPHLYFCISQSFYVGFG